MRKMFLSVILLTLSLILVSCNSEIKEDEINVGVAFYPMKDILKLVEDDLKEEGYKLKIHEFTDYNVPNNLLTNKELDANMIQHKYFLDEYNNANNTSLKIAMPIYHATYALYSKEYTNLDDILEGSEITLPDDKTNLTRAFYLLDQAGLIKLKDNTKNVLTEDDIIENPKQLTFKNKVPLTSLSNKYIETKLAVMYPTYALNLELEGNEQRLYVEKQDDITLNYAISLAAREDNLDSNKINALIKVLSQDKVREFLIDNYSWASSPAF